MPSDKKRVNLTIPDNIYQQIQQYKEENGLANDATACLQLVVKQLKAEENAKTMWKFFNEVSPEDYAKYSLEGFNALKDEIERGGKLR